MSDAIRPRAFGGVNITVSEYAYEMVPIFPYKKRTKRRVRRTRAKYGRIDRMNPLIFETPHGFVLHPKLYADLKNRTQS